MNNFDINLLGDIEQKVTTPVKKTAQNTGLANFFSKKSNLFIAISAGAAFLSFFVLLTIGIIIFVMVGMTEAEIAKTEQEFDNMTLMLKKAQKDKKAIEQYRVNLVRKFEILSHVESRHFDWSKILDDVRRSIPKDMTVQSITSSGNNILYVQGHVDQNTTDPIRSIAMFTLNLSNLDKNSIINDAFLSSFIGSDGKGGINNFKVQLDIKETESISIPGFLQQYLIQPKGKTKK